MGAWLRRSVGATLLIPIGIVLCAGLVAIVGGGLGGLTSLSQLAAGPALPDASSVIDSNPALEDSGLAGSPALGAAAAGGPGAGGAPTGASTGAGSSGADGTATLGTTPTGGDEIVATPGPPGGPPSGPGPPTRGSPPTTVTGPGLPPAPDNPLGGNVDDITSGLDDTVSDPLQPVSDGLLDVLAPNR